MAVKNGMAAGWLAGWLAEGCGGWEVGGGSSQSVSVRFGDCERRQVSEGVADNTVSEEEVVMGNSSSGSSTSSNSRRKSAAVQSAGHTGRQIRYVTSHSR